MPQFNLNPRVFATVDKVEVTIWDNIPTKEAVAEIDKLSRSHPRTAIVINYKGVPVEYSPEMTRDDLTSRLERIELEKRVNVPQSLGRPYSD